MLVNAAELVNDALAHNIRPKVFDLVVSDWADQNRILSSKASKEAGPYRTERTPYAKEPMDELSAGSKTQRVVLMWGSQLGKSEVMFNAAGYYAEYAPSPILMVQPTLGMVKKVSKQRISPMIKESPKLTKVFAPERSREGSNTLFEKEFIGGLLLLATAKSAAELASMPIKVCLLDEIDRYGDINEEGSPIDLAETRTATYRDKKIALASTPLIKGASPIEDEYKSSSQACYKVPCPHCNEKQILEFKNLKWSEGNPNDVTYACIHCGVLIEEKYKTQMLANGEWVHKHPERETKGYWLNSLYSPLGFLSWSDIAKRFLRTKNDPIKFQTFVNTVLAETWEEKGEAPDWEKLYRQREPYQIGLVPKNAFFITAAVDVQKDRLEIEVKAWGKNLENWSVEHIVLNGDPNEKKVWEDLEALLRKKWPHEKGGEISLRLAGVDSGAYTQRVYNFVRHQDQEKVIALAGLNDHARAIRTPKHTDVTIDGRTVYKAVKRYDIGVSFIKSEQYNFLKKSKPIDSDEYPYGFCHFPEYESEYFKQLTAEYKKIRKNLGKTTVLWEKHRDRNEALDLHIYNRALSLISGMDRWEEEDWQALEDQRVDSLFRHGDDDSENNTQDEDSWLGNTDNWLG